VAGSGNAATIKTKHRVAFRRHFFFRMRFLNERPIQGDKSMSDHWEDYLEENEAHMPPEAQGPPMIFAPPVPQQPRGGYKTYGFDERDGFNRNGDASRGYVSYYPGLFSLRYVEEPASDAEYHAGYSQDASFNDHYTLEADASVGSLALPHPQQEDLAQAAEAARQSGLFGRFSVWLGRLTGRGTATLKSVKDCSCAHARNSGAIAWTHMIMEPQTADSE